MEIEKISDKLAIIAAQQTKEREYWFAAMSGEPVKSFFYYDYQGTGDIDGHREKRRMGAVAFQLTGALFERLMQISNRYDYTLYMALVGGLIVLLDKYTYGANKDILIGAPIYKQETEMDFINTLLPLRNRLYEGITFKNLLLQVKDTLVEADKHQNFPIEAILEYLNMSPTEVDFPLFDIAILLKNIQDENYLRGIPVNIIFSLERTEKSIDGRIEYNTSRYRPETIEGIADHYLRVLEKALANIDEPTANIDILSEQEKKQVLIDFNATAVEYPEAIPIHRLFEGQAAAAGDRVAAVGNSCFKGTGMVTITYRHLNEKSLHPARLLHEKGVVPGAHESIVGIMAEDSPEILAGILAIMRAGGAYLPISPHYPEARQKYLVTDSNINILLTDSRETGHFFTGTVININDPGIYRGDRGGELPAGPGNPSPLAYIIYTSGSTGIPKGSLIQHKSVVRLVKNTNFIALKEEDRILKTGAMEFDASTFEIWGALLNGLQLYLERKDIILVPEKLKEKIVKSRITVMWMTSPLFNQVADADIETFSGLRNLLVGGDVLSPPHIYRVKKRFPNLNIINGYGPTENTTFSATHLIGREYKGRIPIGRPIANSTVYIVDTGFCPVPPGAVGELVVGGDGVARGYLNNPELTCKNFIKYRSYGSYKTYITYRTGDLARWLPDGPPTGGASGGVIDFLGRIDFQVKIRGFRVEIGEIESRLMNHEDIRETIVIAGREQADRGNQYYLAAYIVGTREFEPTELRKYLSRYLPDYMIPGYFITLPRMPLTPNGKIDRKALPEPGLKAGERYIPPGNDVEEKLAEIWSKTLGITKNLISVEADFFDLGGHSLRANEVVSEIHRHFNIKIPLIEIFSTPTIRGLAHYIAAAVEERYAAITPAEKREYYKLSPAQERLYILHRLEPGNIVYNMPQVIPFAGEPDKEKLNRVFKELIKRHESLRTSFEEVGEGPVQRIHEAVDFTIRYDEIDKNQAREVIDRFMEPFDLTRAPLMKAVLLNIKSHGYLLLLDLHHIIADGASMALLTEEFNRLYDEKKGLPGPPRLQYKDYSCWQYGDEHQAFLKKQETYWLEVFPDEIPVLDLPIDYARPAVQSFEGNTIEVEVEGEPASGLKRLAHEEGATLYMVLLALFNVFLSRLGGQDDIIVGTPVSGRRHGDMRGIMGMFVNTLAIRSFPCAGKSFKDFLKEVKSRAVEAFENQEYPFEELVEKIKVQRDPGRNPLFDVMFALERMETAGLVDSARHSPEWTFHYRVAKFDLTLTAMETAGELVLSFEYCSRLFKEETMRRFIGYFRRMLAGAAKDSNTTLDEIPMISEEEQKRVLYEFNDTASAYEDRMLHTLFQQQVKRTPDRIAVVCGQAHLSYEGLNEHSDRWAFTLRQKGVGPDMIVGVLIGRSLEMIIAVLGVLKAGGAYLPLDPDYPQERIDYMLKDSNAIIIGRAEERKSGRAEKTNPANLAYVIYTSGTTGKPKGVMIDHRNAVAYVHAFLKEFPLGPADIVIQEAAFTFDVFVEEVFSPLAGGAKICIAQKEEVMDIHLLGNFIARNNITHFTSPPLLLGELNRLENLDLLRGIRTFISGVDVLKEDHISRLRGPGNFYNVYGPTEATVSAAYYKLPGKAIAGISIPIGKPIANYRIYILDKNGRPQGIGVPGEICIAGDGVGRGYLNNPELTCKKFIKYRSYGSYKTYITYCTGDLGRWLPGGVIEFLGRIDLQLKIRGFRVEPGEIENALRTTGGIKDAVVTARKESSGEMSLCAYFTTRDGMAVDTGELRDTLSRYLPAYMVPAYFVSLKKIPLTPGGKVDRRALPEPGAGMAGVAYHPPRNPMEITLVRLWSAVLGVEKEIIGIDANFFHMGGHSLKANLLTAKINKELGIKIPLVELFRTPSIRGLAEFIKTAEKSKYTPINAAEKRTYYPLSSAQKRLFVLQQLAPGSLAYHMTTILGLEGCLDMEELAGSFHRLVQRHESLRTSFEVIEGEPVQKIHDDVEFEIEYKSLATDEHGQTRTFFKSFIRPFDLSLAPLLRVGLIKEKEDTYTLVVDMHHITGDGTSTAVLVAEFMALYEGKELPELRLHYKDYALWENHEKEVGATRRHETFWLNEFCVEIPVLELPTDYPRPRVRDYEGRTLIFQLGGGETRGLKHLALAEGATLYMVLLAIYNILLSRLSGQETIVVGTPTSGRPHADLERVIGMFVNTLVLKNEPNGEKTFREFLSEVKEKTLAAFTHQDYPYDELVEKVTAARDGSRNPLFDAMFILQNLEVEEFEIPGLKLTPHPIERTTSKFDLTLEGIEGDEHLTYIVEYSTRLFKNETIERFTGYLGQLTAAVLEKPDREICRLDILPETEKERLAVKFNDTARDFPGDKTIYRLFEEQVDRYPDHVALVFTDKNITYRYFDGSANRLANYLIMEKGFKGGGRAAVLMERSLEVIITLMGVLKSGGAYIPLDPLQPAARLRVIFDDASIGIVLSQQRFREKLAPLPALCRGTHTCLYIDEPANKIDTYSNERPAAGGADNPAYVMYTSGSSGVPKGVLVEHRTIVNTLIWRKNFYEYRPGDASLQNPPYFFDSSVTDIFTPLLGGARLVLIRENERMDLPALKRIIIANRITHFIAVPAFYNVMVEEIGDGLEGVKMVCVAGEHFPHELVKKHFDRLPRVRIFNEYGPTENSVNSTAYELKPNSEKAFIGKPIDNVRVYILDRGLCLCPVNVTGEICLAGSSLARGYLNNPELTAEKFVKYRSYGSYKTYVTYKTGDLARWSTDGNLEFTGRVDSQVKIRGIRVEVAEIENHLLKRNDIKEAIVLAHENPQGEKYLCAYVVTAGGEAAKAGKDQWRNYLAERLPEYMVPTHILAIEAIPFTPGGKIDRRNLPIPGFSGEDIIPPRDGIEKQLVEIWANVLGTREESIGIDSDFFQLGGHSLRATSLVSRIHKVFNVKIPLAEIFVTPTVRGLAKYMANYIKDAGDARYASIEPVEKKEYYPLSPAQKRLYILHRMEPGGVGYNMPEIVPFPGKIDVEKLEWTFKELIKRHETLRTSFEMVEEQPVQRIHDAVEFEVSSIRGQGVSLENIEKDFVRPFDLSRAPLLRVGLPEPGCTHLLIDLHHIITDGTSQAILTREFKQLYAGEKDGLPGLRLQYKDYSHWQNSEQQRALIKNQETYWLEVFAGEPPVLNLPFDYPRPLMQSFQGKTVEFLLSLTETRTLKTLARDIHGTLYMSILAVFNVLLSKLSGQEDIVVGTPVAGRRHADLEPIIGMFVNTLALRNRLPGEMRFQEFLGELKSRALETFENQEYPFEELVEKVPVKRDTGRNPLFDVMFNLLNQQEYTADTAHAGEAVHKESTSKFDLTLTAVDLGERLFLAFEYCSRLFEPATIERFIAYYRRILYILAGEPDPVLSRLEIITEEEKNRVLYEFNDTGVMYPLDSTIHGLFEQQVEQTPDHIAVFGPGRLRADMDKNMPMAITYRVLNEKSDGLAARLMERGVKPDTIVAIMPERTVEMMMIIYGVLKAGGAYLPIDPGFPRERIDYMLQDSAAKILLTVKECVFNFHHSSFIIHHSSHLAYAIYTSGSTGKPKGVMIEHGNVVNFFVGMSLKIDFSRGKSILALTTITFDIFVLETLLPLAKGLKVNILDEVGRQDPLFLEKTIAGHCIDMLQLTPSRLKLLLDSGEKTGRLWPDVKELVVGGEAFPGTLFEIVKERFHGKIYNVYGPTETAVWSSLKDLSGAEKIDIGTPIANTHIYIVDKYDAMQPLGVPGELCIGGSGVARGYLNRPGLTAEKFIKYRSYRSNKTYIFYKTGDLARWLPDPAARGASGGVIDFLGRIDHQVKIRGFRIELGEIESRLLKHNQVKEAVVIDRKTGTDKYLCAYIVPHAGLAPEAAALKTYLSAGLPDYMIPSYFIPVEKIPLNPSGKIDRQALPEPGINTGESYCAPRDAVEEKAAEIWAEVLHLEKNAIGIDSNFFQLGGHSLSATIMIAKIHKELDVTIPLGEFFKKPTIRELVGTITTSNLTRWEYRTVAPAEKREYYPLSPAQMRLYLLYHIEREGTVYNLPFIMTLEGNAHIKKISDAFQRLIKRHESLRTSFITINNEPVQRIHDEVEFEIENVDLAEKDREEKIKKGIIGSFIRAFDLSKAPLLRVGLIKTGNNQYIFMTDIHHIIADGFSMGILIKEFMALYEDRQLPEIKLQYKDYSEWRRGDQVNETSWEQENFWLKEFEGEIPVLELPTDYIRPVARSFEGSIFNFEIDGRNTKALKTIALEEGSTLYMVLLAVYDIFLAKLTSQEVIVVGTVNAGRSHADLENTIGMFVNTLPLRSEPNGEKYFKNFLKEVKQKSLEAFANQDYPYEQLVESVAVTRDTGRNPIFDTLFTLQTQDVPEMEIPGLKMKPYSDKHGISKFDLTLLGMEINGTLTFVFEYCSRLFRMETVDRFAKYFQRIISGVLENPDIQIADIEIISEKEKEHILIVFNNTITDYPRGKTIHRLFEEQASAAPDRVAIVDTGFDHGISFTFKELNTQAGLLAGVLIEKGIIPGDLVAIIGGRSQEMVKGVLGILKAGAAYLPIDIEYPPERIDYMLKDSAAKLLAVANDQEGEKVGRWEGEKVPLKEISKSTKSFSYLLNSSNLAYVIYTSGSTGKPKGVMVTHRNVVRLVKNTNYMAFGVDSSILQTGAPVFDATTFEIWGSLLNGGQLVLVSKETILDVVLLGRALKAHGVNTLWLSAPLFNQLLQQDIEIFAPLCYLLVGGDVLSPGHINKVRHRFPLLRVINGYGPTENTTFSVTHLIDMDYSINIPIGQPISNSTTYIVDKNDRLQPMGIYGELLVGGDGVALGYMNNPELTADRFKRNVISHLSSVSGKFQRDDNPSNLTKDKWPMANDRLYKTGDLVRWLPDPAAQKEGSHIIEFLGRIDRQIKIRGFRVELGEIENRLLKHEKIKDAAVIANEIEDGNKYLCAYIVCTGNVESEELREYLSQTLPDYMIPSYFITIEKIPLNPNGKIDRQALPAPEITAGTSYCAPRNALEEKTAEIWAEVLHIEKNIIGIDTNFFQLGGHSLSATIMIAKMHKELDVILSLGEFFNKPTIRDLVGTISGSISAEYTYRAAAPAEKQEYYLLSPAQKRLYLLHRMDQDGTVYNLPFIMTLEGDVQIIKMTSTFQHLIKRHESLRTSFIIVNSEPMQKIHDNVEFEIQQLEINKQRAENKEAIINSFIRPFDLSCAPLLRVGLIKTGDNQYIFMTDIHHIIADGFSMGILIKEFMALYDDRQLPEIKLQYKDYSEWQYNKQISEIFQEQENFWLKEFEGDIPVLELPTDYVRPIVQSFEGNIIDFEIDGRDTKALKTIAMKEGSTLYMVLLALYHIFLAKLTSQESIVVGTVTAGRSHADLGNTIGMFVNTLALRSESNGEKNVNQFLNEVKEKTLEAFENQDYQYDRLVERVVVARDTSRNPIFDTLFILQTQDIPEMEIPGLKLKPFSNEHSISKFDLTLLGMEINDTLSFSFEYCTKLFRMETVERFAEYFRRIISGVLEKPDMKIADIEIISEKEKEYILFVFNNTATDYPREKSIHRLFEEQVLAAPDRVTIVDTGLDHSIAITFKELNTQAGLLAGVLIEKGIIPGDLVAIIGGRSLEMVKGFLGILKAGAAYLPIDIEYPPERIDYMLKDSAAKLLAVANDQEGEKVRRWEGEKVPLEEISKSPKSFFYLLTLLPSYLLNSSNLAYVIYTSGSTGKPKGVMVTHRNVVRLVKNTNYAAFGLDTRILQTGAPVFDATTFEIWGPLLNGGLLVLVPKETILDAELLGRELKAQGVNTLWLSAPLFNRLLQQDIEMFAPLRYLIVGGDVLSPEHINKVRHRFPLLRVTNGYGPTENTTFSVTHLIDADYSINIPIGRPISNSTAYIVDKNGRLQPVGIYGELLVGGDGVALGYMNNPELTGEKFIKYRSYKSYKTYITYRTGDMARWLPDGPPTGGASGGGIEFLGRIDRQVKIRGFRVEPGEIENLLLARTEIKEAVVSIREREDGEKYLAAYIVLHSSFAPADSVASAGEQLRDYLSGSLPDYMIPSYFVTMDKIPLTANGKVDRKALPEPGDLEGSQQEHVPPSNAVETKLVQIWSELLGIKKDTISINADFFRLGGHSLKAAAMMTRIQESFDVKLDLVEIFTNPTVRKIATLIKATQLVKVKKQHMADVNQEIEELVL